MNYDESYLSMFALDIQKGNIKLYVVSWHWGFKGYFCNDMM